MDIIDSPRVSVVIAAYNVAPYVEQAVNSILQQTYTDFELIILDDGSTDGTWEVLERLAAQDARIWLERNPANMGVSATRNRATELARGEFIAVMDADDLSTLDRLEKQVTYLDAHPEVGAVGGQIQYYYENDGMLSPASSFPLTPGHSAWQVYFSPPAVHGTALLRRSLLIQAGGYRSQYTVAHDYDLWERLIRLTHVASLPDVTFCYRRHGDNITSSRREAMEWEIAAISQRAINAALDVQFSLEEARLLQWGARPSPHQVYRLSHVIKALAWHIKQSRKLSQAEWILVRQDAARRCLRMVHHYSPRSRYALYAYTFAAALDSSIVVRWVAGLVKNSMSHRLRLKSADV